LLMSRDHNNDAGVPDNSNSRCRASDGRRGRGVPRSLRNMCTSATTIIRARRFTAISRLITSDTDRTKGASQTAAQSSAVTHTAYSARTELFAEWRPFVVGEATRLTAHLAHTGDRFRAFEEGRVTLKLTAGDAKVSATADAPERAGVFRLNLTPTKDG